MNEQLISSVTTVALALVGVGIIAVLVSRSANTTNVLSAGGGAFTTSLGAALSPVTGSGSGFGSGFGSFNNISASI